MLGFFVGLIMVMQLFPETPLARQLHEQIVERPLRRLQSCERRHIIFLLIILTMIFAGDALLAVGSVDLLMVFAWDTSLYVDIIVATWAIAGMARGRSASLWVRAKLSRQPKSGSSRQRGRARRFAKPARRSDKASNDDEGHGFAVAA